MGEEKNTLAHRTYPGVRVPTFVAVVVLSAPSSCCFVAPRRVRVRYYSHYHMV